jgi:hypothetical protein
MKSAEPKTKIQGKVHTNLQLTTKKDGGTFILPEYIGVWNRLKSRLTSFDEQTEDIIYTIKIY